MALAIVVMFGYVIWHDPADDGYAETLKNVMVMAVGYYLGASKIGSDTAAKNADIVYSNAVIGDPLPVTVVNDDASPVPVEAK